jgi:hypothetical protein
MQCVDRARCHQSQDVHHDIVHGVLCCVCDNIGVDDDSTVTDAMVLAFFERVGRVSYVRKCSNRTWYLKYAAIEDAYLAIDVLNYCNISKMKPIDDAQPDSCRILWSRDAMSLRDDVGKNVIVRNIDRNLDNKALHARFDHFGDIITCKLISDVDVGRRSYHSVGLGFVRYATQESAKKAAETMNGRRVGEDILEVLVHDGTTDIFEMFGIVVPDVIADIRERLVITCIATLVGEGSLDILCVSMSGEELAILHAHDSRSLDIAWLRASLAMQLALPVWKLRLVGANAEILMDNLSLVTLLPYDLDNKVESSVSKSDAKVSGKASSNDLDNKVESSVSKSAAKVPIKASSNANGGMRINTCGRVKHITTMGLSMNEFGESQLPLMGSSHVTQQLPLTMY